MFHAEAEFIPTLLFSGLLAAIGWIALRSFFANPEQFLFALTVKCASFGVNLIKWVFHLIAGFLSITLGVIYAISPIDIIPDVLVGIGWVDDVLVLVGTGLFFLSAFTHFPKPGKKG